MHQVLSTFIHGKQKILAFGFVEDQTNRTKTLMRQAYGYRNLQNLRLRILVSSSL